jgi:hypothetical protein
MAESHWRELRCNAQSRFLVFTLPGESFCMPSSAALGEPFSYSILFKLRGVVDYIRGVS